MTFTTNSGRQITDCASPSRTLQLPLRHCRSADPENYRDHDEFSPGLN